MKVTVRGEEHSLERPRELGRSFRGEGVWSVEIDGRTRQVEVIAAGEDQLDLVIDGRRVVLATARAAGGAVLVSHRGRARRVEPVFERRRRGGGGAEVATKVTPSFPATVVSVLVEVGEPVERGQALVVVSAMKMEMTLTAPTAGVVEAVNTIEGAAVSPGDELVVVAAAEEEGRDDGSA